MKKIVLLVLLCGMIVVGLTGCGKKEIENEDTDIITATTSKTVTTGNIPKGNFNLGDEYIIKIFKNDYNQNKYHFFVLSVDESNVNLIIDRNMRNSGEDTSGTNTSLDKHDYGPYYHMEDVFDATHAWHYIPAINFTYTDEKSKYTVNTLEDKYVQFKNDTGKVEKVLESYDPGKIKARLPYLEEIMNAGCKKTGGNIYNYGTCPLWLSNNLMSSEFVTGDKVVNNEAIKGYYTMSTDSINESNPNEYYPVVVTYNGDYKAITGPESDNFTVRPVISIPKDLFK